MWKKLLIFSLAFCLGLFSYQLLKLKVENNSPEVYPSQVNLDNSRNAQTQKQISSNSTAAFKELVKSFQIAVINDDRRTVASFIHFPIRVWDRRDKRYRKEFKNENEFLLNYDKIFDEPFKNRIARIDVNILLFSTSGEVFTPDNEIKMDRIYKNNTDFEAKIISFFKN